MSHEHEDAEIEPQFVETDCSMFNHSPGSNTVLFGEALAFKP